MANMKVVYTLWNELVRNPEHVKMAQTLTLNGDKPLMGLKGTHGLYGSEQWWQNVECGVIASKRYRGVIRRLYVAGQDPMDQPNAFEIEGNDGIKYDWNIVVDSEADRILYQVGRWVEIVTISDELKIKNEDCTPQYSEFPLEISLSTDAMT